MLRAASFVPVEAEDAARALSEARGRKPAAAIVDVVLPGPDGVALLAWLKAVDPDMSVLMMTGQADLRTAIACLTRGADAFLLKPVREAELAAVVERSLERRRLVLENRTYQRGLERMVEERTAELRQATERLQELDQLKSEFVSRVSHELRSPLTVMRTNLSVLLEGLVGPVTPGQVELLGSCQDSIDRLSRLIENVLDLSRIESGNVCSNRAAVDPFEVVQAVVNYLQAVARERRIELRAERDDGTAGTIWADSDQMHQVLLNLVDNALKFTPPGGTVRVSVESHGDATRFAVHDTGTGVPAQVRDRIFDRFVQGPHPEGTRRRGVGLGLSIARSLVELHGGSLEVSSEEGRGATFAFVIPRESPMTTRPGSR